jgi:steroid 5-alpha reductase family enzyme
MTLLQIAGLGGLIILVCLTALWILSLILKDASIIDSFWGTGFVILAWVYFLAPGGLSQMLPRDILLMALVTLWGLRLSLHILIRNWGKGEDYRYQEMRRGAGQKWWWLSFFQVFLLQGVLIMIVSAPLLGAAASHAPENLSLLDVLAAMVWTVGFFFEAVGDAHLVRFKRNPANKGKLLTSGVWTYTRHPNYFGDAAQWWGFYLLAVAAGAWWTIFGPVVMTFLLVRVSGVAMLEKALTKTKPGYEDYLRQTSAFVPALPRDERAMRDPASQAGQ